MSGTIQRVDIEEEMSDRWLVGALAVLTVIVVALAVFVHVIYPPT